MLTTGDMCPYTTACQGNPYTPQTPDPNSDLDSDGKPNVNSAWAGIAVVLVVFVVGLAVWYAIRRKRRARGGHNSVDAGAGDKPLRPSFGRAFGAFWRRRFGAKTSEQSIAVGGDMELVGDEEAKHQRPGSSSSNLKRTTTSGTLETDNSHAPKLDASQKEADEEARLYPMTAIPHQSVDTTTSALQEPQSSYDASRTSRPSTPTSARSSLSQLGIPPPGLGPPVSTNAQTPLVSHPPPAHPPS
ncbi:hypothetical protein RhiJN_11393 [Ceratobasidium sp. AG-Ba]|nr:hypothetical protein RhiJN_11393 [Ceratobasidium sp. AG-Ba]QRW12114.1 hypothetical protein RhiLY_11113 [Ceratobasidium sp. AG-Ba]